MYSILVTCFIILCVLLTIVILVQQSKSSSGIGAFSGQTQMLFGGSGGQDFLQKLTWVLGALFMLGSLALSLYKSAQYKTPLYRGQQQEQSQQAPAQNQQTEQNNQAEQNNNQ